MDITPEIEKDRWQLLWAAQRSQRYHSRRNTFFDRWNKATALIGVVGGSSVVASLGQLFPPHVGLLAAAFVVLMSGIDLVAGTGEMARRHNELRRRFCELEASIVSDLSPTEAAISQWKTRRLAIESDEPPTYVALDLLCYNELARAHGHLSGEKPINIPMFKAMTAQLMVWPNT